jgi:hypothetical protein
MSENEKIAKAIGEVTADILNEVSEKIEAPKKKAKKKVVKKEVLIGEKVYLGKCRVTGSDLFKEI